MQVFNVKSVCTVRTVREIVFALVVHVVANGADIFVESFFFAAPALFSPDIVSKREAMKYVGNSRSLQYQIQCGGVNTGFQYVLHCERAALAEVKHR